jgi:hypothetical protein
MGGFGSFLAVAGAALALTACGTSAHQPSALKAAAAQTATSHPATPAPATSSPARPAPAASQLLGAGGGQAPAQYGNPDGHAAVPAAGQAVSTAHPDHVIGNGTPASCTSAAVVATVALGGIITFNCGPNPVTITMTATAEIVNGGQTVIDGGGKVTLSGGGQVRILDSDTCPGCWEQADPQLVVQNMRFTDGYSGTQQTSSTSHYGGGAIFAIYTDGDTYNLVIDGSAIGGNSAREGGGGIFCVVDNDQGALTIENSALQNNTSGEFQDAPGIFDSLNGHDVQPTVTGSVIS